MLQKGTKNSSTRDICSGEIAMKYHSPLHFQFMG
jgi:hypothetical protein